MTTEARIANLMLKNALGSLTDAEQQELEQWKNSSLSNQQLYDQYNKAGQLLNAFQLRNERNRRISGQLEQFVLEQQPFAQPARVFSMNKWKWVAAAAVVVFLGIAAYLAVDQKHESPSPAGTLTAEQIRPGKDGAVLTLADGSQLSLDTVKNGVVALQDGVTARVIDGALVYQGNGKQLQYNTMSTPKGRQYQLTLPDGTRVWLNAASSIRYPVAFTGEERSVSVTGEAYFEVAKLASQPFRVAVDNRMSIDVLGTSFNVNAYPDDASMYTTLLDGAVRVSATNSASSYVLKPAQQAVKAGSSAITVNENVDTDKVMAWKNGLFNFEGASLEDVMKQIERWYDIDVKYEKGIPDIKFWGKITKDVPLSGMLIALEKTKVRFRLENSRTLVVLP